MFFSKKILSHIAYPQNWSELKKEVLARDDRQCQGCGAKNTELHVHHRASLSRGGSNALANLVTLCRNCHREQHSHMRWVYWVERNRTASIALRVLFFAVSISALVILITK